MIGGRIEIGGTLRLLSPLHVGTGGAVPAVAGAPQVAAVARDHVGRPYLPGSTLKGVLRRLWQDEDGVFGPREIGKADDAVSGAVIFRNAWMTGSPDDPTFAAAHVRIDGAEGVAAPGLLFQDEMVRPGTSFGLRLAVMIGHKDVLDRVRTLLAQLTVAEGVAFGGGTRQGDGRLKLDPMITLTEVPGGGSTTIRLDEPAAVRADWTLRLHSDVPFLIHDPARSEAGGEGRKNVLRGLKAFDGTGERLTGSSLLGALRAAFAAHVARVAPDRAQAFIDTLFGTARGRGRLAVRSIAAETPKGRDSNGVLKSTTSVRIDRFSGAPIDNALFATEGHFGTTFVVDLVKADRTGIPAADAAAADAVFQVFLGELTHDVWGGLMLGHVTGRGYGWFSVTGVK